MSGNSLLAISIFSLFAAMGWILMTAPDFPDDDDNKYNDAW